VLPDPVVIVGIFKGIKPQPVHKFIPVQNQKGKSPEGFFPGCIFHIDRVKKKGSGAALYQFKRTGNGVLAAFLGKLGFLPALRLGEHVKSDGFLISLQGIYLGDQTVLGQLKGFDYMFLVLKQRGHLGKLIVRNHITAFYHVFHKIGSDQILVHLGFDPVYCGLCGKGSFHLLFLHLVLVQDHSADHNNSEGYQKGKYSVQPDCFRGDFSIHIKNDSSSIC